MAEYSIASIGTHALEVSLFFVYGTSTSSICTHVSEVFCLFRWQVAGSSVGYVQHTESFLTDYVYIKSSATVAEHAV